MITPLSIAGVGMLATTAYAALQTETRRTKKLLKEVFEIAKIQTKKGENVYSPRIKHVRKREYGFDIKVELPKGYTVDSFRKHIPDMEQMIAATIELTHLRGREVLLKCGTTELTGRMIYDEDLIENECLTVPVYTPFGIKRINFWDEATCHLIVAGSTRMGKSVFLRLMFTSLILQMQGNVRFFYINNKVEDYFPLEGLPQIPTPGEDAADAIQILLKVKDEIQRRKDILRSTRDAVNIRQFREKHPEENVSPLFVVFDEYGRFAEDEDLQLMVQEIAETAGYLDIHLVIATQRPDAITVLKPRIRANILTRLCFQTADETNSNIVIHTGQAAHLDNIRGRAILLDGPATICQVPYVSEEMTMELLMPYRSDQIDQPERREDPEPADTLPGFVEGPVGATRLSRSRKTGKHSQPHLKAIR